MTRTAAPGLPFACSYTSILLAHTKYLVPNSTTYPDIDLKIQLFNPTIPLWFYNTMTYHSLPWHKGRSYWFNNLIGLSTIYQLLQYWLWAFRTSFNLTFRVSLVVILGSVLEEEIIFWILFNFFLSWDTSDLHGHGLSAAVWPTFSSKIKVRIAFKLDWFSF